MTKAEQARLVAWRLRILQHAEREPRYVAQIRVSLCNSDHSSGKSSGQKDLADSWDHPRRMHRDSARVGSQDPTRGKMARPTGWASRWSACRRFAPRIEPYSQCVEAFDLHGASIATTPAFGVRGSNRQRHLLPFLYREKPNVQYKCGSGRRLRI